MLRLLKQLRRLWPTRIRYQLICGVALVHLLLMTIFVFDLVGRQREFLKQQSLEATEGLVQTLAVNSVSWVLASDVVGLQEIVRSVRQYPGLRYAMVVTGNGQVLAHTDATCVGLYLNDEVSRGMLTAEPHLRTLCVDHMLLDVAAPVVTATGQTIGWARVGQGQERIWSSLHVASRNGILYTLLAIVVGSILAVLIGNRLTSGLNRLLVVSGQIRDGRRDLRMEVGRGDEVARLGDGINQMLEAVTSSEAQFRVLFEQAPDAILVYDADRERFLDANPNAERLFGCRRAELLQHGLQRFQPACPPESQRVSVDWRVLAERALAGENVVSECAVVTADGGQLECEVRLSRLPSEGHRLLCASYVYLTERKRAEEALQRIEWMLSKKHSAPTQGQTHGHDQGYGDLTALNRDGVILKSIGCDVLGSIAADYLDLLGTSSAIYEVNGDYAFGIFTSNWCRMLDRAARRLCATEDNAVALSSGKWLCHESCWTRCSKQAIATRAPVDIECSGGIRLYGVPIVAGDTVIGSINFGYGDVPRDPATLQALAQAYQLNYEDVRAACEVYNSRPPYIVEMAKNRLHASARLIGMLVERKRIESVNMAHLRLLQFAAVHSLDDLLEATLNEAEELTGSLIGFYHFLEADQKTLSLQNWSTRTTAEFCTAEGKGLHYDVAAAGVWGDCVRERRPVIHNDYASLPHRRGMPPGHAPVVRELVVPVFRGDKIVAILGVGNKPQDYCPEDVATISRLADLAWEIAERKRAEEELGRLNLELDQRVRERTAQLEAVNQELEAFAYSVSHDLRAPLRHVDGFLDLLQKRTAGTLDEQCTHYVTTIADAAQRMGTLIDDLLSFSRMGRSMMATEPVDLAVVVREVIEECAPDLRGRSVNWHVADLPVVAGDRAMLRVVFANLISNALKFTRPRLEAEIEIGWLAGQDAGTVVFVRDNGVGFDATYAGKLFGVFQRLHRAEEFEGTGIGLANVRRVIQRHGGRTWAEGRVDGGATFYFSLPRPDQGA